MDPQSKVCRACLGCCPQEYYSLNHGTPSYQFKLQECVPFMDLKMILDPIICVTCAGMLDRSYQLLIVARNVESRLFRYLKDISCVGMYYIMAEKPHGRILEHFKYHTVVDNTYNFNMVIAMAAKTEVIDERQQIDTNIRAVQIQEIPLGMIKVENVDTDYVENVQMPTIDLIVNQTDTPIIERKTVSPTRPISNSVTLINPQTISSLQIHTNTLTTSNNTSKTTCNIIKNGESSELSDSDRQLIKQPNKPLRKAKCKNLHHCPICNYVFSNLANHMKIHFDTGHYKKADAMSDIRGVLTSISLPPLTCLQCGSNYLVNESHKCLFSSYVRLERMASLDSEARTLTDSQLSMQKNANEHMNNNAYISIINEDEQTDDATSTTLTALSVCDDGRDVTAAHKLIGGATFHCSYCQLRFDNSVQLKRHMNLSHTYAESNNENRDCYASIMSIHDEHSYAKLKSIQCWNCAHSFATCDTWLRHDHTNHRSDFFICYICFRGYRHTRISAHLAATHSLPLPLPASQPPNHVAYVRDPPTQVLRYDDTFARICAFVMRDHRLTHCPLCQHACGSSSLLVRHLVLNRCTVSKCMLCRVHVQSSLHFLQHLMTHAHRRKVIGAYDKLGGRYLCQVCDAVFAVDVAFMDHVCGDAANAAVLYRRKMGVWECATCAIMSPFGSAAKQRHIRTAVHLKLKLVHLLNTAGSINDLRCHLCAQSEPYAHKSMLFEHLLHYHVESLTVLCPLCHFMTLNPDQYTHHLQLVHPNVLNQRLNTAPAANTLHTQCPDEFTCLLCKRKHWTLSSFWETCGKGHKQTFSLEITLKYLSMFDEQKWLHFNGTVYTCECGQQLQNSVHLYRHYKSSTDGSLACCTFWSRCDLCGALISPRSKLNQHKELEHSDSPQLAKIRCKNQSELFAEKCTAKNQPMRKRRKTNTFINKEENALYEACSTENNKKQRSDKHSPTVSNDDVFEEINLSEVGRINDPRMQPMLRLDKLALSPTYCDESWLKSIADLHMVESIERVVRFTDDDDDDRSTCSSDLHQSDDPLALDDELSTINQQPNKNLITRPINDEKNQLEIPIPFIEPKLEQLNIHNDNIDIDDLYTFPVDILFDSKGEDLKFNSTLDIDDLINDKYRKRIKGELTNEAVLIENNDATEHIGNSGHVTEATAEKPTKTARQTGRTTTNTLSSQQSTAPPIKIMYKCDWCHMLTASRTELTTHSCRSSKIDIVQCALCQKNFLNGTKLHAHMLHEHSTCGDRLPRTDGAVDASELELPRDGAAAAAACGGGGSSDGQVVSVVSQTGVMLRVKPAVGAKKQLSMIRCSLCQQLFENMSVLIVHMKTNHFSLTCVHCDDKFPTSDNLSRHLETCVCALRNRELNRIIFDQQIAPSVADNVSINDSCQDNSLPNTSAIHYNIFRCLDCDIILPGFYVAKEHFTILHKDAAGAVYSCQICDTLAVDMQLMKQHKGLHTYGVFMCIVCQREFKSFADFEVHFNEYKMAACPHCPRMFLDMNVLRTHINYLHGGKK